MISTELFHHNNTATHTVVRSHRLQPTEWVTIFCILSGDKESIISVLEDHILESISGIEWSRESIHPDFTFLSENFNHFIQNIDETDRWGFWVILAVLIDDYLVFSHTGDTSIILVEKDGSISNLSNNDPTKTEFQSVSSGEVAEWSHVYISNVPLETHLSDDIIRDLSDLNATEWKNITGDILRKELQDTIHIGYISHMRDPSISQSATRRGKKQIDVLRAGSRELFENMRKSSVSKEIWNKIHTLFAQKKQETKYAFLFLGVILLFTLLYFLFSAIFSVVSSPERDMKTQLLQAQELITNSQKLVNDPVNFNKTISEAETILFELRNQRVYMTDTQSLLSRIEAMKKEVNDIQTIDMAKLNTVVALEGVGIDPIWVFEYNKKLTILGRESAIIDYNRGGSIPTLIPYPVWEQAVAFDFGDDGSYHILTQTKKILGQRGTSDISYVTNNGQKDWEATNVIATFNGNLYLAGNEGKVLKKYRPGINGFSSPTDITSKFEAWIVDIGIDGGIYLLMQDGKVIRYTGGNTGGEKGLLINKVPGEYNIGSEAVTQVFVKQNLSYVYILSGKNIWIFEPDSKRFQDVTAWNYIAQLELQSSDEIRDINIPRDGLIYITTSKNVYELPFEVADGKIILR